MEWLMQHSSLENIAIDNEPFKIKNRWLSVNSPDITYIEIFDIFGKQLYHGAADQDISLENVHSSFIIAKYLLSNKFLTSKILIR